MTLSDALIILAGDVRRISDVVEDANDRQSIKDAATMIDCLRTMARNRTAAEIHAAFGAPGDFGYETPIGSALSDIYRGVG